MIILSLLDVRLLCTDAHVNKPGIFLYPYTIQRFLLLNTICSFIINVLEWQCNLFCYKNVDIGALDDAFL